MIMPVIFAGHGSPMLALEDTEITRTLHKIGSEMSKPKAILSISAHWYTHGTYVQSTPNPKQIFDMYGFPKELYEVKYEPTGSKELTQKVMELLDKDVKVNDTWGIDHGTWTVLCHMFPNADIPVVQLSVNGDIDPQTAYEIGKRLAPLREKGYLIFGSGNIVHNLRMVEWNNKNGTKEAISFNDTIVDALNRREDATVINYKKLPYANYAVPTPDHYLPLLYILGAAGDDKPVIFNNSCNLGSIAMTGAMFSKK